MRYAIVIEKTETGYSAYVPDLPGCVATGATLDEVLQTIDEAIRFQVDGLRAEAEPVPVPTALPECLLGRSEDPFVTFTEWAGEADGAAYANL